MVDVRFLPNPHWIPELRDLTGEDAAGADYVLSQESAGPFLDKYMEILQIIGAGYRREGKQYLTLAVGCTGGKHRSVAMAARAGPPADRDRHPGHRGAPGPGPRVSAADSAVDRRRPKVVALGGGHGLYASLSALRPLDVEITAVVTVADDGGSSGRIRRELGVLPPGDLRMALAALADYDAASGRRRSLAASVLQHRLGGTGALAGHPIGNLLLTGLLDLHDRPGAGAGRARPADRRPRPGAADVVWPLDLIAEVTSVDTDDPVRRRRIRGQSAIAATAGPGDLDQVGAGRRRRPARRRWRRSMQADAVILGPGSWFTSVIPHLLVPELAAALTLTSGTPDRRSQPGATGR